MRAFVTAPFILTALTSAMILSCSKETSQEFKDSGGLLQNKWIMDSIVVYSDPALTQDRYLAYTGDNTFYFDFRTDGKLYSYAGIPIVTYDTATYGVLADQKTLLMYPIINGVAMPEADTATIKELTATSLVLTTKSTFDEYGVWYFKK